MFFDCDGKLVNLDHVAKVRLKTVERTYQGGKTEAVLVQEFVAIGGEPLASRERLNDSGSAFALNADVLDATAPVIPNTTGICAHVFYPIDDHAERPTDDDIALSTYPILGWRIVALGGPEPILATQEDGGWLMLELPSGEVVDRENQDFPSLREAREYVLERSQKTWDKNHPPEVEPLSGHA